MKLILSKDEENGDEKVNTIYEKKFKNFVIVKALRVLNRNRSKCAKLKFPFEELYVVENGNEVNSYSICIMANYEEYSMYKNCLNMKGKSKKLVVEVA